MPNGQFVAPTPELQIEFEAELQKELQSVRAYHQALTPAQRAAGQLEQPKFNLQLLEKRATHALTQRYMRIGSAEELRLAMEAGEVPEFYPGEAADYLTWKEREAELLREERRLEASIVSSQQLMDRIGAPTILTKAAQFFYNKFGPLFGMPDPRASGEYEAALAQYNADVDRLKEVSVEISHSLVYQSMYEGLAAYIQSGKVTSYDDLFTLTDDEGKPITIFQDIGKDNETLRQIFGKISAAVLGMPGDAKLEELSYDEMIAQLAKEPTGIPPTTIQKLTVQSILQSLVVPEPVLPEGYLSIEEVLDVYSKAGIPDELVEEIEGLEAYTNELEGYWEAISANQDAVRKGLEEARMPEMGVGALLLQTISQPALTALDVFSKLYTEWIAPWGGFLYRLKAEGWESWGVAPLTTSERKFLATYREALNTDDWWHAGGEAFANTEIGLADRFLFEWVADPLTWLGTGLLVKIAGRIPVIGVKFLAPTVGLAERGWLKAWDVLIFDRIKSAGRFIQKTPMQASKLFAGRDMVAVERFLVWATNNRNYRKIPLAEAVAKIRASRGITILHPEAAGPAADMSRAMLRHQTMDESQVVELGKRLGSEVGVSKDMIIATSSILEHAYSIAGQTLTRKALPAQLLRILGVPESKVALTAARKELNRLTRLGVRESDALLSEAKNVPDLLTKVFNHSQNVYLDTLKSAAAHNLEMSGRIATTMSKVDWVVMDAWRNTMDRWVVTPGARMYLAFAAYGPGNILEGFIKQGMARQIPFNPLKLLRGNKPISVVNPTARGQKLMSGVSIPLELRAGIARIEMAGETSTYLGIERMSSALKKWRSITSGGPLGKVFIDWPGGIGTHQRWDYYRKGFLGFLGDETPEVMQGLAKTIDDVVKGLPDDFVKSLNLSRHEFREALLESAVVGPATTRGFLDDIISDRLALTKGISKDAALGDRVAGGKVAEVVGKYPLVPEPFQDVLINAASDGSLWAKGGRAIDGIADDITAGMYDYFIHSPEFYKERFAQRVKDILALEARNKDEFTGMLQELQDLQKFYTESVDDATRAMSELEREMHARMKYLDWTEWRAKYRGEAYGGMASYGDVAQDGFEQLMARFKTTMDDLIPIAEERASISKLFTAWSDEQRFLKDFWTKRRKDELEMIATKPKGREAVARFWDDFFGAQEQAHLWRREHQAPFREASIVQEYLTSEVMGNLSFKPITIDVAGRKLNKMDVATLFRGHSSQLPQSMLRLETMTLKSRNQFIIEVKAQAKIMSNQAGKTPSAMGWTDDAIGEVYDTVLRDMYMNPRAASVMEPHLMELKGLQDELWSIYNTKAVPKGMADDFQKFIDDLANKLDGVPGYAGPMTIPPGQLVGYRAGEMRVTTGITATEGAGLYVGSTEEFVRRWGKPGRMGYTVPKKPLMVGNEMMPALQESSIIWKPIMTTDTPWIRLNKQAAKNLDIPVNQPRWPEVNPGFGDELTRLARKEGYDAFRFSFRKGYKWDDTLIGKNWDVLLDESLWKVPPTAVRGLSDDFSNAKQRAADKTSKEYYKDWADYTNENASTALMRTVYPFWTYELHRLFWLPRASIRTPGLFKAWGTYMDYTEDGYFHIPGTSLEFNLLRGTIFMGGMLRLIRKDYPEYYDRFPGFAEGVDFYSRYGFYPATYLNLLKVFGGTSSGGKANFGEILPAWVKTPLNAYLALFPDSKPAKLLLDTILPEPFRNYTTVLVANKICQQEQKTFNGMDIFDKMTENLDLTEEEQDVWTRAIQQHGWMSMIMEQAAVLRIRTEEQMAAWEASGKLIEELTGYTLEDQLWIRRHGFRTGDYAQLDPLGQALLGEMDAMKYHSGIFNSLLPTTWQDEDRRRREFFGEVRDYSDRARADQEELDRQARAGEINMTQWARGRSDLRGRNANFFTDLSETERYRDIAITLEDTVRDDGTIREGMITRAEERNMLPPVEHPAREILNTYYSIELEKKFDPASGKIIEDWDSYFLKIDTIIRTLEGVERDDLIDMITRTMTDLERLRWEISKRYFRGYNRRQEAILTTQFDEEQQSLIKQWIFGSPAERDRIQLIESPEGTKLIASYQKTIRVTGQNLRKLSPELDAWLQFFEITDTTLSDAAAELYSQYRHDWGIPE